MKGIKHALCYRALRGAFLLVLSLAGVQVAFAQPWSVNPGNYNVGYKIDWGHGIQPTVGWNPAPIGSPSAGSTGYGLDGPSGGRVAGRGAGRVNIGPTVIDVQAKVVPTHASVGRALGNFAKKVLPVISTALAIKTLLEELGYNIGQDAQGNNVVQKPGTTPAGCYIAPCYYFNTLNPLGTITGTYNGLGEAQAAYIYGRPPGGYFVERPEGNAWDYYRPPPDNTREPFAVARAGQRAPDPTPEPTWDPATWAEIEADIAARNQVGWPTGSAAPEALRDAVVSGEPLEADGVPSVTGPSSAPGPKTTKTDSQGNVTTTNTTHNITYNTNNINYTTTTVTTVNGVQQSTETTEEQPAAPKEDQPDQCEKYPNSAGCADLDVPDGDIPKTTKNVTFNPENLGFGGGTCPADKMVTLRGMPQPVKVFDWQDTCGKLQTYARPMILALATFAALMIIFGARVE